MEVYYEWIQKLTNGLQIPTINNFLTTNVLNRFTIIHQNCDYKDEMVDTPII